MWCDPLSKNWNSFGVHEVKLKKATGSILSKFQSKFSIKSKSRPPKQPTSCPNLSLLPSPVNRKMPP